MKVNIITPEATIFEGEVNDAFFVGIDGHFEIRNNHAPMVAALTKGDIRLVDNQGKEQRFSINSGLLEISDNNIQILAQ